MDARYRGFPFHGLRASLYARPELIYSSHAPLPLIWNTAFLRALPHGQLRHGSACTCRTLRCWTTAYLRFPVQTRSSTCRLPAAGSCTVPQDTGWRLTLLIQFYH